MLKLFRRTNRQNEYFTIKKDGIARLPQTFVVHFWNLIGLNLLFLGFCIPIMTIPAALTAMTRITIAMIDDEYYDMWGDFFRIFKREFGRASLCGWTFILAFAAVCYGVWFYFANGTLAGVLYIMAFVLCLILILLLECAVYIFPMLAITDLGWEKLLKNALLLSLMQFFRNIPLAICSISFLLGSLVLIPLTLPLVMLLAFSSINLVTTFFAKNDINKYVLLNKTI
jgi:uncharacterized membrane protein YesL